MKMHAKSYVIGISSKALNLSHGQMDGWMSRDGGIAAVTGVVAHFLRKQGWFPFKRMKEGRKEGERTSERKKGRKGLIEHAAFYRQ